MIQFLQERIQPQEVLRIVLIVILIVGAAYLGVQKFVAPEIAELTTQKERLSNQIKFEDRQIANLEDIGSLSYLRTQLAAVKTEFEERNLTLEGESTADEGPVELISAVDAGEMKIGKVNEAIGRSGIFVRDSIPGGVEGDRRIRRIIGEGKFNSVIRALSGMEFLDVLVTGVVLERMPDSDDLKVTLNLAI